MPISSIHIYWHVTLFSCVSERLALDKDMPKSSNASVMDAQCPSRLVLHRIADKWTALVIQLLARRTMRHAALQPEIGGLSQQMLTQTLRSLERDAVVHRTVHHACRPHPEFHLT